MKYFILFLLALVGCNSVNKTDYKPVLIAVEYTDNQRDTIFYPTLVNETFILESGVLATTEGYIVEHEVKSFERLEYNPDNYGR